MGSDAMIETAAVPFAQDVMSYFPAAQLFSTRFLSKLYAQHEVSACSGGLPLLL